MARSGVRLGVFAVLVAALIAVLLGRTVQLQVAGAAQAQQAAQSNRVRVLVEEPTRGMIVDQVGRPLAASRQVLRVVVDRDTLYAMPGDGADILTAVAGLLGTSFDDLDERLTPCDSSRAVPQRCWAGGFAEPIPVATDVPLQQVLPILEQPEEYPGVALDTVTVRSYPGRSGERAAHLIGHLGEVTQEELAVSDEGDAPYRAGDLVGRGGLEQEYEQVLRGTPGRRTVTVDTAGRTTATLQKEPAVPGGTVITSIDAGLQAVVEQQLAAAVERARDPAGAALPADSGAAVVVDVTDGRILAMASYPDYSPSVFDGGIATKDYRRLQEEGALLFTPVQGRYAPGSTFKPFTAAAMATAGYDLRGSYPCPSSYTAGGLPFANYESRAYGTISLARALEVSCNTVFYAVADQLWAAAGGERAGAGAPDPIRSVAEDFGLGTATGIDLPGEAGGQVAGRATKIAEWQERKDAWCAAAEQGYPQLRATDPALADEYTALDRENCESGGIWRQGDAINAAIGQGSTAVTPLQLAMAYAAIANGGTRYRPEVGKAIIAADGTVTTLKPEVVATTAADPQVLQFLRESLQGVTSRGSAAAAFMGFPLDQVPVAGKTGSAQVPGGRPATSWFASFAPADNPRYAVVLMVTQGGTGGGTSAPSVRAIYEAIFGVSGGTVDAARSVLLGGAPSAELPHVGPSKPTAGTESSP